MNDPNTTHGVGAETEPGAGPEAPPARLSRREAIQWVMAAVAASALPGALPSESSAQPTPDPDTRQGQAVRQPPATQGAAGYGTDVPLTKRYKPGAFWPLTFTDAQRKTAGALADVILPKDQYGPAASEAGVVAMMDEWISAPYPVQQADRPAILEGLAWIDAESAKRFAGKPFADLPDEQKRGICDDVCFHGTAKPEFAKGAAYFSRFRSLAAGAYYATPAGWKAIGYVGNAPLSRFDGPPAAVLKKLGVTQTVV